MVAAWGKGRGATSPRPTRSFEGALWGLGAVLAVLREVQGIRQSPVGGRRDISGSQRRAGARPILRDCWSSALSGADCWWPDGGVRVARRVPTRGCFGQNSAGLEKGRQGLRLPRWSQGWASEVVVVKGEAPAVAEAHALHQGRGLLLGEEVADRVDGDEPEVDGDLVQHRTGRWAAGCSSVVTWNVREDHRQTCAEWSTILDH